MSATSPSAISARRANRKAFTVLALAGALLGAVLSPASAGAANGGVLFGATPPANGGNVDSLHRFEADLGEDLDLVRVFMRWDEAARGRRYHQEILDGGRTMLISVRAARMNGAKLSWNSIANSQPGSQIYNEIVAWADYFKTLDGERVWFVFNHEPEIGVNEGQGSSDEFRSAYRRVHQIFNRRGAGNVQFGWIMTNYSYELQQKAPWDRRAAAKWYPGDDVVDLIGSDPYDWSNCRTNNAVINRPMGDLLQYFNTFAKAHPAKGLLLGEWASTLNRNSGTQADFINQTKELVKRPEWAQMVGISYFAKNDPAFPNCVWDPRGSGSSMDALRSMARDPHFNGVAAAATFDGKVSPGADSWEQVIYQATETGRHTVTLGWSGDARLRSDTRSDFDGAWLGANLTERSSATYTVDLVAGRRYRIAVWTRSGTANYRVEVRR